jgi:hypothetical protein
MEEHLLDIRGTYSDDVIRKLQYLYLMNVQIVLLERIVYKRNAVKG